MKYCIECPREARIRGLCQACYDRALKAGTLTPDAHPYQPRPSSRRADDVVLMVRVPREVAAKLQRAVDAKSAQLGAQLGREPRPMERWSARATIMALGGDLIAEGLERGAGA